MSGNSHRSLAHITGFCLVMVWLVSCGPGRSDSHGPDDLAAFVESYTKAHHRYEQDPATYWRLFQWEGTEPHWRSTVERAHYLIADLEVSHARVRPWMAVTDPARFFPPGTQPNLEPKWVLEVEFETDPKQILELPIGRANSLWKIIQPIPQ
jgi:hypothetical protein